MAFRKVWFLMWQLIGLGLAQTDIPVAPVQAREFEAPRQESCPRHYQVCNNFCYRIFSIQKTWDEAEGVCNREMRENGQGHLLSILSDQENNFVKKLWLKDPPPRYGCSSRAWIGLRDTDGDGNSGFVWSDGEMANDYSNWAKRQPRTNCNKFCAFLRGGVWKTKSCDRKMPFICKVPL